MRIWSNDVYSSALGPNFRTFNEEGTLILQTTLATTSQLNSKVADYLPLAGGTLTGTLNFKSSDKVCIDFRSSMPNWTSRMEMMGNGNDAIVWANRQSVTSFMFFQGIELTDTNRWDTLGTPAMQIKSNCVSINKLIANGVTPSYTLDVNGSTNSTTLYENGNRVITAANIGSQSVNYATSAGNAGTWTTARTLTIGNTGKSVNGSGNVSWSLSEIGAQPSGSYVTTNTSQVISEIKNFDTYTNTKPLRISRRGTEQECLSIGCDDSFVYFHFMQDERSANYRFTGQWDNSEPGDTSLAGSKYIEFHLNGYEDASISINGATVLHSGNYSSYALSLSGGKISASSFGALQIERTAGSYASAISFYNTSGLIGYIGLNDVASNGCAYRWNASQNAYMIWDQGNDGSGSGLDADLLDGKHATDFSLSTHYHDKGNANLVIGHDLRWYSQGDTIGDDYNTSSVIDIDSDGNKCVKITAESSGTKYWISNGTGWTLKSNTTYVWSYMIKINASCTFSKYSIGHFQVANPNGYPSDPTHEETTNAVYPSSISANTWTKCWIRFTTNELSGSQFRFFVFNQPTGSVAWVRDFKLEEGDYPTGWVPNDEDFRTSSDTVKKAESVPTLANSEIDTIMV